jgi:hypothetical protein
VSRWRGFKSGTGAGARREASTGDVVVLCIFCACAAALVMAAVWIVEAAIAAFVGAA